jgi:hypothetical protein
VDRISKLIPQRLRTIAEEGERGPFIILRKSINAFLPYAIRLGRDEQRELIDAISEVFNALPAVLDASRREVGPVLDVIMEKSYGIYVWKHTLIYIAPLFEEPISPILTQAIVLSLAYEPWVRDDKLHDKNVVTMLAAAASAVPYTEEVARSVVGALLQVASIGSLRPHIPIELWAWLEKRPPLPPTCIGRKRAARPDFVRYVRELGNIGILKSYLIIVWSEWDFLDREGFPELCNSAREDFRGIGSWDDREDLVERLNHILES